MSWLRISVGVIVIVAIIVTVVDLLPPSTWLFGFLALVFVMASISLRWAD